MQINKLINFPLFSKYIVKHSHFLEVHLLKKLNQIWACISSAETSHWRCRASCGNNLQQVSKAFEFHESDRKYRNIFLVKLNVNITLTLRQKLARTCNICWLLFTSFYKDVLERLNIFKHLFPNGGIHLVFQTLHCIFCTTLHQ